MHVCMCACAHVCVFMCARVHVCMCDVINDCEKERKPNVSFWGKEKKKEKRTSGVGYAERSVCVHGPRYSPSVRFGWHFRPLPSATPQLIS